MTETHTRSTKSGTGRRVGLSRQAVIVAALRVVDQDGLEALSMRRLGAELDVDAMTLYHYVEDKSEVLDGIVEDVIGEIDLPTPSDDWKEGFRELAQAERRALLTHPNVLPLVVSRPKVGRNALELINTALGLLREGGFDPDAAHNAWHLLQTLVLGFLTQELNEPLHPGTEEGKRRLQNLTEAVQQLSQADYPYLAELARFRHCGYEDEFAYALQAVIVGLEWQLEHGQG